MSASNTTTVIDSVEEFWRFSRYSPHSPKIPLTERDEREMSGNKSRWENVSPDVLGLIFVRLPADERVATVALVCKAWLEAVSEPYTWSEIDIDLWCRRRVRDTDVVDSVVRNLVRRSKCGFRRLSACRLGDSGFSYAIDCARCLKVLQIPMSMVTDNMVEKHAKSLSNLTMLDISYCSNITSKGIEAFGKHCKRLINLTRSMPPLEYQSVPYDDSEALSVAENMRGLRKLYLCHGKFGNIGLSAILTNCKKLTHLDVQGCRNLEFDGGIIEKSQNLVQFVSHWSQKLVQSVSPWPVIEYDSDDGDGGFQFVCPWSVTEYDFDDDDEADDGDGDSNDDADDGDSDDDTDDGDSDDDDDGDGGGGDCVDDVDNDGVYDVGDGGYDGVDYDDGDYGVDYDAGDYGYDDSSDWE